jgi:hypothetical protein
MKFALKFLKIVTMGVIGFTLMAGVGSAEPMHEMMNENNLSENTLADRNIFISLWDKAFTADSFTPEQVKHLVDELARYSKKLAENYAALDNFWQQKSSASGDDLSRIQKRIDLKEKERDLIVLQAKVSLEEFLTKEQATLVLIAGFHGISSDDSGDEHLRKMFAEMNQQKNKDEPLTLALGKMADKYNRNCQAETLEIIRDNLNAQFE